ncbi:hypothetical protein SCAB_90791 [Streptomyces scabiei 87.22]|uniref:Uncharacterized protein n=1 Tax=Streptomyces scabiei (strain 87.22) TaxID=680198 RepID=C9Z9T2_STRSW|nr:hypothetical protein SCAB_90791 [Streptomyces scabiei 87.22]
MQVGGCVLVLRGEELRKHRDMPFDTISERLGCLPQPSLI